MSPMNYYNEHDKNAAAWLRELIRAGEISDGVVDERDIQDVKPTELSGFNQCHFFAGIGGWSLALRLAGVPDDARIWSGSCPCQPFSLAGGGLGEADERHLWPDFRNLIGFCRPPIVIGEQVAKTPGFKWLAGIRTDLERAAYAVGGSDLCAAGLGAPHIRQRIFWMANDTLQECHRHEAGPGAGRWRQPSGSGRLGDSELLRRDAGSSGNGCGQEGAGSPHGAIPDRSGIAGGVADATSLPGSKQRDEPREGARRRAATDDASKCGGSGWMEIPDSNGRGAGSASESGREGGTALPHNRSEIIRMGAADSSGLIEQCGTITVSQKQLAAELRSHPWDNFAILPCRDGKARRIESGTFPLAHGIPGRVGLLRGYGNAIVAPLAAKFIEAGLEAIGWKP